MATPAESPSTASFNEEPGSLMGSCSSSSHIFSPTSDKRFWSTLRNRVDYLLENRKVDDRSLNGNRETGATDRSKRLKEDSMLLLRGFDSVAQSLSQLSHSLDNAVQGARKLRGPPRLAEIVLASGEKFEVEEDKTKEEDSRQGDAENRGLKRKLESVQCCNDKPPKILHKAEDESSKDKDGIKKVKTLAIAMAAKASSLAREMKSIQSDLGFMQERYALLEEENAKLREGLIPPDEDDLVRLQLEALLAEKSRLATENANLKRENQSLHQLVEYHQLTSQDLSETYENLVAAGMCLDFSSPAEDNDDDDCQNRILRAPLVDVSGFSKSLAECFEEQE